MSIQCDSDKDKAVVFASTRDFYTKRPLFASLLGSQVDTCNMSSNTNIRLGTSHTSQLVALPVPGGSVDEPSLLPRQQLRESEPGLYSSLDPAHSQIRILRIHPADDPMAIPHCSIEVFNLDQRPHYVALSYEWGDPKGEEIRSWEGQKAVINGKEKTITKNLYTALLYLRRNIVLSSERGSQTRFWIDAVCINQDDNDEKASQVALMGKIYSMAQYVVLWVGVDKDNSSLALAFIKEATGNPRHGDSSSQSKWYIQKLNDPNYLSHWIAFGHLVQRSYWRRSWIIQEIVLAPAALLICGNDAVPMNSLFTVAADLVQLQRSLGFGRAPPLLSRVLMVMLDVHRIRESREDYRASVERKRGLLYHLENLCWTLASDPRDKVYSLLGIAKPYDGVSFSVDYTISSSQVFKNTAAYIIKGTQNLDILTMAGSKSRDLPSWVPDWSDQDWSDPLISGMNRAMIESVNRSSLFSSGGATYSSVIFSEGNGILITDAILVSTIEKLTSTKSSSASEEYSLSEVVAELVGIIEFIIPDYREVDSSEMHTGAAERLSGDLDLGKPEPEHLMCGHSTVIEMVLVSLYKAIFWTASFASRMNAEWPCHDFVKFCKDCVRGKTTLADCTPQKLALLGTALSNGGVGRKFFKCRLPEEFDRTEDLTAGFTSDQLSTVPVDVNAVFARTLNTQAFGHGRGLIEVGDTIAIIPGCKSPLILRRAIQENGGDCYRLIGEAYCVQLMDWASLPKVSLQRISLC
jgi:hypothetical protein